MARRTSWAVPEPRAPVRNRTSGRLCGGRALPWTILVRRAFGTDANGLRPVSQRAKPHAEAWKGFRRARPATPAETASDLLISYYDEYSTGKKRPLPLPL